MDILGVLWIPDGVIWILMLLCALYWYGTWSFNKLQSWGYKGPKPIPFLGNVVTGLQTKLLGGWDLTGKALYGKVYGMYEGRLPTIIVFDTDVLKEVEVAQFSLFYDRRDFHLRGPVLKHSLFDSRGEDWKRIRNLATPFFTTSKLRQNIELLKFCTNNLEERLNNFAQNKEQFEARIVAGAYTLEAICLTAFGIEIDSQKNPDHPLLKIVYGMSNVFEPPHWGHLVLILFPFMEPLLDMVGIDMWPSGSIEYLTKLTKRTIEERQNSRQGRPDFIHSLMKAHEADVLVNEAGETAKETEKMRALTDIEIIANGAIFIQAGHDLEATGLSFLLFLLADNPTCQDRVAQEITDVIGDDDVSYENLKDMKYLDMCLDESLRMYPPALRTDRKCMKDTTIKGYFIPKDLIVIVPIYALHHDPEYWQDPEIFDPERFSPENRKSINPYAYQPFGTGLRNCVGFRLAQVAIKMAAIGIIRKFKVNLGENLKLPFKIEGLFPRAKGGLWLQVEKRC